MNWFTKLYAWACERLYDEFAWSYDAGELAGQPGALVELAARGVGLSTGLIPRGAAAVGHEQTAVLELGFGTGELLSEMARRGACRLWA